MATNPTNADDLDRRLQELLDVLKKEPFVVLVWGPGSHSGEDYQKRLRVRDYLATRLGADRVLFSEDDRFRHLVDQCGMAVAEDLESLAVDVVVILDTTIGPHTEISRYEEALLGKALVFVKQEVKDSEGFAGTTQYILKTEGISPEEYVDCSTTSRKANRFAQALLFRKARPKLARLAKRFR